MALGTSSMHPGSLTSATSIDAVGEGPRPVHPPPVAPTPSPQGAILSHVRRNHRTHRTPEIARQAPSGSGSLAGTSACLYSTNG